MKRQRSAVLSTADEQVMYQRMAHAMGIDLGADELRERLEAATRAQLDSERPGAEVDHTQMEKLKMSTQIAETELQKSIRSERLDLQRRLDEVLNKTKASTRGRLTGQSLLDAERAAHATGRNATAVATQKGVTCKVCGNNDGALFVTDGWNADMICRKCGNVVRANQLQDKDWSRVKTSDTGEVMSSIGDKEDHRFSASHNLRVNFSQVNGANQAEVRKMRECAAYIDKTHHQDSVNRGQSTGRTRDYYKDKKKRQAFDKLEDVCSRMSINMGICNSAKDKFAAMRDDREAMHKGDKIILVCLFTAWQETIYQEYATQAQMLSSAAAQAAGSSVDMPPPGSASAASASQDGGSFSLASLLAESDDVSGPEAPAVAVTASGQPDEAGQASHAAEDDEEDEDVPRTEFERLWRAHSKCVVRCQDAHEAASTAQGSLIAARQAEAAWQRSAAAAEGAPEDQATVSAASEDGGNPHSAKATEAEMAVAAAVQEREEAIQAEAQARQQLDAFSKEQALRRMAQEDEYCKQVLHPFWASYDARVRQVAAMRKRNQKMRFMDLSKPPKRRRALAKK